MRPVRRIVCADAPGGKSKAIHDGPAPEVRTDPARPGFSSTFIWATDATPARIDDASGSYRLAHLSVPPPGGSLCRIVTLPPDGARAPRPAMQRTRTLDFCLILEGEITLVLDTEEVALRAGDTVVQRGTRHAWSNRSSRPCMIAISSHDATD
jgi:mannose-6-phosphate isomerase-like protein (cupin superfamily)